MQIQPLSDRIAIGLSFMCILHCLLLPALLVLAPSALLVLMSNESVHKALLFVVIPVSTYALLLGYKSHKNWRVLAIASCGLVLLTSTGMLEHEVLGETGEIWVTVLGSVLIAFGHRQNTRLRKRMNDELV